MKIRSAIIIGVIVIAANIIAHFVLVRWDMTEDKRYSVHDQTKQLVRLLDAPMTLTIALDGDLNAGFTRLRKATEELGDELSSLSSYFHVQPLPSSPERDSVFISKGLMPTTVHEREQDGRTTQLQVWPYAVLTYKGRTTFIPLLQNNMSLSGDENLNASIENLEFALAENIYLLTQPQTPRIAFLEGHGELPEMAVYDISMSLARYFQIDRGAVSNDPMMLDNYKVVIIADPQEPFSEKDKYILDQYVMHGGRILWLVNGIRMSQEELSKEGFTPVIPLDLNIGDMLFNYGIRVNPTLLQDVQCLSIPVNVSADEANPNYQPVCWYYAPLMQVSPYSPITRHVGQVSGVFVSHLDAVGDDSIYKEILLATSTASKVIATPAEVDLDDFNSDLSLFRWQHVPVAVCLRGMFPSAFHHRMPPEGVITHKSCSHSQPTKQIVVATGSVIRNDWQHGHPLPVGYDRYSRRQFGNRDFLTNAVLYLADDAGLIELRQKEVALRLINDGRAHQQRMVIQIVSVVTPIILLALIGLVIGVVRRRKYVRL